MFYAHNSSRWSNIYNISWPGVLAALAAGFYDGIMRCFCFTRDVTLFGSCQITTTTEQYYNNNPVVPLARRPVAIV